MTTKRLLGRIVEFQDNFSGYTVNGRLIRPLGKIVKIINKKRMIVMVKHKDSNKITKERIGQDILFI